MAKLHLINDGRPPLNDIPARLRWLADEIDKGEGPLAKAESLFVIVPRDGDFPVTFGFGDVTGVHEPIVQFNLALQLHLNMIVRRG